MELAPYLRQCPFHWFSRMLRRVFGERMRLDRFVQAQFARRDPPRQNRQPGESQRLGLREGAVAVVAVAGHDDAVDERHEGGRGRWPVERVAIAEGWDRTILDEIAGEHDAGTGDGDDDVVVGMAAPQIAELDRSPADFDRHLRREGPIWWIDDDLGEVSGELGLLGGDRLPSRFAGPGHECHAALVTPDRCRPKDMIPVGVVEVAVGIHDDRDGCPGQLPEVGQDVTRLGVGRAGIDDEHLIATQHDADVLVEERVATDEHAFADLDPVRHDRTVACPPVAYAGRVPSIVSHVHAADGTDILVRRWPADEAEAGGAWAGSPWASVLIIHGLGEHSGRYEHVGDQFASAGIETYAYDQRGNGGSGGRRGHVDRWAQYHDDLEARLGAVRVGSAGRPVVLYGHSLGGLIVLGYLLTDRLKPDLAVLASPGLDSTLASWKKAMAPLLGRLTPTLAIPNGIDGSTLSRDPSVAAKGAADPLNGTSSTARFGAEALNEQARVNRDFGRLTLPTLVLHGEDDGLVPPAASEVLASLPNVERRTYPGLRHELHNEPEGPQILDEVIAWIRDRATITAQLNTASGERLAR